MSKRPAIKPTQASLRRHFRAHISSAVEPIRHPESVAFKTRFKGRYRSAAVLVPIIQQDQQLQLLLTQRAEHLRHHPGQISFPGGSIESVDNSLEATALRESHEEIGLEQHNVELLGRLGDYYTVSGYCVTPVVGLVKHAFSPTLDASEVSRTLTVPLNFLMSPDNFSLQEVLYDNEMRRYFSTEYQSEKIWGVTAGIIVALYEALLASHR